MYSFIFKSNRMTYDKLIYILCYIKLAKTIRRNWQINKNKKKTFCTN